MLTLVAFSSTVKPALAGGAKRLTAAVVTLLAVLLLVVRAWAEPSMAPVAMPSRSDAAIVAPADAPELPDGVVAGDVPSDFGHHDGGWLHLYYAPSVWPRVEPLIAVAEQARVDLRRQLGEDVLQSVHIRIARTVGEMANLAPKGAPYPAYASGVAYSRIGLVLLAVYPKHPNSVHNLEEILRHELVHVALHDALKGHDVPRWFNEGLAVHLSGEGVYQRTKTLWVSTLAGNLLPLSSLDRNFPNGLVETPLAYAQSADIVRYLLLGHGEERFAMLLRRLSRGQSFESALDDAYAVDLASLEYDWRQEVAKRYSFWPLLLSGSVVWIGAIGLFFVGWWKKRKKQTETLQRWAREEALEEARAARLDSPGEQVPRVHIVLSGAREGEVLSSFPPPSGIARTMDPEVPKVEHDGNWHTLH